MTVRHSDAFLGLLAAMALALPNACPGQTTFERTYGGLGNDRGREVHQTADGGYIVVGYTNSYGSGGYDVYLAKTDSVGDTMWTRTYGGSGDDRGYSVKGTADGGYIVAGRTASYGAGEDDMYLIKTDANGDTLWTRWYGGAGSERGLSVVEIPGVGYAASGYSSSFGAGDGDLYLVKTNLAGDTVWTRAFGGNSYEQGSSLDMTPGGDYVMAGYLDLPGGSDALIALVSDSGDSLWARTYGDIDYENARSIECTSDGGFVIAGKKGPPPTGDPTDVYVVKTNSAGDVTWANTYGGSGIDDGWCVKQTFGGGFIVAGTTDSVGHGSWDAYLIRLSSPGNLLWARLHGGSGWDGAFSCEPTSDGGYIVSGTSSSCGSGGDDLYLLKTDTDGLLSAGTDAEVTALLSPGDTVFCDSVYSVTATVTNSGNACVNGIAVATLDGYQDTVQVSGLTPGASVDVAFADWIVPAADSTRYTMEVCIRVEGDVDSTNDCMEKTIFAVNPPGIQDDLDEHGHVGFGLWQNEPNPFSGATVIKYSLPEACHVRLRVYDVTGRSVFTLVAERQAAGMHEVLLRDGSLQTGVYFYHLEAGGFEETRMALLLR